MFLRVEKSIFGNFWPKQHFFDFFQKQLFLNLFNIFQYLRGGKHVLLEGMVKLKVGSEFFVDFDVEKHFKEF